MPARRLPTLALLVCALSFPTIQGVAADPPPLPEPATSFGACVSAGWVYSYGGNTGAAHEFDRECVKGDFYRWKAPDGKVWEKLGVGIPLLSCPLVPDEETVIRIGGTTARNEKGAKSDLRSIADVVRFNLGRGRWNSLPSLPEPRSSHDAAVLDRVIFVGGGWNLTGGGDQAEATKWHDTILALDLHALDRGWQSFPQPFKRRALAMAAHAGRIWFIGGIDDHDSLSSAVDWFDPSTSIWGKGPDLPAGGMAGFGAAACEQDGRLYVSPVSGKLLVLSAGSARWEEVGELHPARYFHRLLPFPDHRLMALGGSSREGHVAAPEILSTVPPSSKSAAPLPAATNSERAAPWPQWRGPNRDGISAETGWRKEWPKSGPPKLWSVSVGVGMSSPVVAGGILVTQGNDGNGTDQIVAFDAATGAEKWRVSLPVKTAAHEMPIVPNGPASTPTVADGRVYALTREGDFICLDLASGKSLWQKNFVSDLHGKRPVYGYAQSPLVAGGRVIVDVGGERRQPGSTVALDAATGEIRWRNGIGEAGYSSARMFQRDGRTFAALFKGEALDVFDPDDGRVLWSYGITGADFTNALTPVFVGHRLLVSNTSEPFARLLDWDLADAPNVHEVWKNQHFALLFNNPILLDGVLFAFNEKRRIPSEFSAIDAGTGETRWTSDAVPIGTFILADHYWIFLTRSGEVVLAPAKSDGLQPSARFQAVEGKCYATLVLAGGRLYIRSNAGELAAYDLRSDAPH